MPSKRKAPLLLVMLLLLMFASGAGAQTKGKPAVRKRSASKPKATKDYDLYPFATPIEVRIGYHRQSKPAIFMTLKNEGSRLTIKSMMCTVLVMDPIKIEIIKDYQVKFDFAVPIGPGETMEAVKTEGEVAGFTGDGLVPSRCKSYETGKDPTVFVPGACTGDALTVNIFFIEYTDGTRWFAPDTKKK